MSVLGNIAQRLKTDIAETNRAIVDLSFSQKLTEDRFNEKSFTRKAAEERRAQERRFAFEAAQQRQSQQFAFYTKAGMDLFDTAVETGEPQAWNAFAEYASNPNLPPEIRSTFEAFNKAQGTKTLDQYKFEYQKIEDARNMTYKNRLAAVQEANASTNEKRYLLEAEKQSIDQLDALEAQLAEKRSAAAIENFFSSGKMLEEEDRATWQAALAQGDGSYEHAKNVFDTYWKERHQLYANARNALDNETRKANAQVRANQEQRDRVTVRPSPAEVDDTKLAIDGIVTQGDFTNYPGMQDWEKLDDNSKKRFALYVAAHAKKKSRAPDGGIQQEYIPDAIREAIKRIEDSNDSWDLLSPSTWGDANDKIFYDDTINNDTGELKVGDVRDGYRYNGGPPGAASSWTKI